MHCTVLKIYQCGMRVSKKRDKNRKKSTVEDEKNGGFKKKRMKLFGTDKIYERGMRLSKMGDKNRSIRFMPQECEVENKEKEIL